jgi:hypothetical protein
MINITGEPLVILYRHLEQINWSKYHKPKFEDIPREISVSSKLILYLVKKRFM